MKIAPITRIKPITFGEGATNNMSSNVGLLSLQNTDKLNFEKSLKLTKEADAVQSNPIKAFGYKITRAYNILFAPKNQEYSHITYMV